MNEPNKRDDVNDAVEDALGFNFRSVKTLIDLFVRPRRVFESYAARDRVTYTPAIRIFFGLIGLQVLTSVLWGGWSGLLTRQIEAGPADVRALYTEISGGNLPAFINHCADALSFGQPILVALFTSLSVFVLGWFRPQLSWPSRMNIAMGVLSVGTVIGLLSMPLINSEHFMGVIWIGMVAVAVAYFLTIARGARGVIADSFGGVIGKSLIYTFVLLLLVFLAGVVLSICCIMYATMRLQGG
ncbi:MAG: DUF3667 domain-containing protein [Caulobacteraceae bacterium]|nr:DUF3667 domain-containing protein [Caulobacteraceae bacterium]MBK8543680.1 DUF3667 domain-containing protein [Caulobacteraceae bacterium]MBP6688888.1 DUF3667 domain-containing protein [Hyphomonadaceae bacterium]